MANVVHCEHMGCKVLAALVKTHEAPFTYDSSLSQSLVTAIEHFPSPSQEY
jgi:hypothetical protein